MGSVRLLRGKRWIALPDFSASPSADMAHNRTALETQLTNSCPKVPGLVNIQFAIENGDLVRGFSHEKWWIFP